MQLIVCLAVSGTIHLTLCKPFAPCAQSRYGSIGAHPHVD
jgi:hypothetical protein